MTEKKKPTPPICPYCGMAARLIDNTPIYGTSYGKSWICVNYPDCDSYVGAHRRTGEPFGSIANQELREARGGVHGLFDQLWTQGKIDSEKWTRSEAYAWFAGAMEMKPSDCHVGMFDLPACKKAIQILQTPVIGKE